MTRVHDLTGVETEHLLGEAHGPLVTLRCSGAKVILLGQIPPAAAREIAMHLLESAARAEYESDFHRTATTGGMDAQTIGQILHMVRLGETDRHTNQGEPS